MEIYDVHAHVYPRAIAQKAAEAIGDFYQLTVNHQGRADTLLLENEKAGITHSIIHSVAVTWEKAPKINDFISKTVKENPEKFTGFAAVHPQDPDVATTLEKAKKAGLRGIKLHPDFQNFAIDDSSVYPIYQWAQKKGFPILVHTGDTRYTTSRPEKMAKVLKAFPALQVVCAHLGGWSQWEEAYKILSPFENAWVDTSSSLYALSPQKAKKIIENYGSERVLFGTDYPMWNPKEELERFYALNLAGRQRDDILYQNAKRLLAG